MNKCEHDFRQKDETYMMCKLCEMEVAGEFYIYHLGKLEEAERVAEMHCADAVKLQKELDEKDNLSCPNCERLREVLNEALVFLRCVRMSTKLRALPDFIIKAENALALPSEEKGVHETYPGSNVFVGGVIMPSESGGKCPDCGASGAHFCVGKNYDRNPRSYSLCPPVKKEEHVHVYDRLDEGNMWCVCGEPPPFEGNFPVKKEPEEIAESIVKNWVDWNQVEESTRFYSLIQKIAEAIRSERSTAPKESGGKCEHEVTGGWHQEGEPFMNSDGERKKCPFCRTSRSPVKKEQEEIQRYRLDYIGIKEGKLDDDSWEPFKESSIGLFVLYEDHIKALLSERSTAPKDCGREEAIERVVDAMRKFKKQFEAFGRYQNQHLSKGLEEAEKCWPEVSDGGMLDFGEVFKALDALEALEKRRKVNE